MLEFKSGTKSLIAACITSVTLLAAIDHQYSVGQTLPTVVDIGLSTRFQDNFKAKGAFHQKRGRANICADFNNDGLVDIYVGNPGDESFIMVNQGADDPEKYPIFQATDVLLDGTLAWGAAAADYDDDGDIDLFISVGGNEGIGFDIMLRNSFAETGELEFQDVSEQAGVTGPTPIGEDSPVQSASANAVWLDYDRDGDLDLWVNTNDPKTYQNILWHNMLRETGVASFQNVTSLVGLEVPKPARTLHSSWSDFDHDGDMDLYENNFRSPNRYWKNTLVETGVAGFVDATASASLPGESLAHPINSFGSAAIDFNNDGFDDILCAYRLRHPPGPEPSTSPYGNGHAIFINDGTGKFSNLASDVVKLDYPELGGVMGFMVGDLNGDAYPEIYLGNGGPNLPQADTFLISDGTTDVNGFPNYFDGSSTVDFPAPQHPKAKEGYYPEYPYRTHGTTFADTNNDGNLEILVCNGGKAASSDAVREPNRHFVLNWETSNYFVVRLIGDGLNVNLDGIGARLKLTFTLSDGSVGQIYRTVLCGTAFSAQNDIRAIHFALADVDTLDALEITWSDGTVQSLTDNLEINSKHAFFYGD